MAGAGYKLFNTGDVLTAAQVNTYLQEQAVMRFASAAARTTALSGVLAEGMVSYLMDTDAIEVYNGTSWVSAATGDITGVTTGATSGLTGGVTSGTADLKLNTTAKGGLLVGTGSGTVTELAVGSNTQVLQADSTTASGLKWATASSGSYKLIKRASFSNVANTGTTFDDVFSSSYNSYDVIYEQWYAATGSADAYIQFRYAGPTTATANYYTQFGRLNAWAPPSVTYVGQQNTSQVMVTDYMGGTSSYGTCGRFRINNIGTSTRPFYNFESFDENEQTIFGGGYLSNTRTYTGLIFSASTSNIYGTISIYGIANS